MNKLQFALLGAALALGSIAEAQTVLRVRGTITGMDGNVIAIKSREGKDLKVELTEKASVATVKAITLAELKQGSYVGITSKKNPDGSLVALEVHTLPPTASPGYRPWDLAPDTMMTNANVASVVQGAKGHELAVDFKEGAQKILVPAGTPVVTTENADRTALKPGESVFAAVDVGADGKMTISGRIQVSKDGVRPPQ